MPTVHPKEMRPIHKPIGPKYDGEQFGHRPVAQANILLLS